MIIMAHGFWVSILSLSATIILDSCHIMEAIYGRTKCLTHKCTCYKVEPREQENTGLTGFFQEL